jgi:hypothetical protein
MKQNVSFDKEMRVKLLPQGNINYYNKRMILKH